MEQAVEKQGQERPLNMPNVVPLHQYKNWKKLTNILNVKFKSAEDQEIEGLLIADKVGEIHFLNINNLNRLPKDLDSIPSRNAEGAEDYDYVVTFLYAH